LSAINGLQFGLDGEDSRTLYAGIGRRMPLSVNSPTGSTSTTFFNSLPDPDKDLTGLGFVAKTGRDIRNRPDGSIVSPAFKSDSSQRSEAMRDANTEAKVVTKLAPFLDQSADYPAHIKRHQDGLQRRILDRDRIIENDHHTIASKSLKRAAVLEDDLADSLMVIPQQR